MATSVHNVAAFILREYGGPMTCMKLEKLAYYSQAWSLVWDDEELFHERIEAWVNGPVCPDLYQRHRGQFKIATWTGNASALDADQVGTVRAVLKFYGKKSSQELSDLTHQEEPWRAARKGLNPSDRGSSVISHASMAEYYSSL